MLDRPWPIMDRIIGLRRRALFADATPTRAEDMVKRFTYKLDPTQKRFFQDEKFKPPEPASIQPLRSLFDPAVAGDRVLWQIKQQIGGLLSEKHEQEQQRQSKNPAWVSRAMQHPKQQMTPEQSVGNAQRAVSRALDTLSIDHIRITRRCLALNDEFRRMWYVELEAAGMDLRSAPGRTNNDSALLIVCHEALNESKNVREVDIYTYRPDDGDSRGKKGWDDDPATRTATAWACSSPPRRTGTSCLRRRTAAAPRSDSRSEQRLLLPPGTAEKTRAFKEDEPSMITRTAPRHRGPRSRS
ncbi:hypothetical protein DL765_007366 [Monosporascus sp. GIB2]|nr:hypothetical protein DL765_007366 [Monosporascus sp. GIB2]